MRRSLRRFGMPVALGLLGIAVLLAGTAASLGYVQVPGISRETAAPAGAQNAQKGGLEIDAVLDVDAPVLPGDPLHAGITPPVDKVPLPGVSVDRDLGVDQPGLGCGRASEVDDGASQPQLCFGLDAALDIAAGSHRVRDASASSTSVSASSAKAVLTPTSAPVVVAAAAFTLAGLVVYFWGALKAFGTEALILPVIGMYAKISRAEVFDNTVRERIFGAIRDNPGLSASDLSRVAEVSWGTTIYHLDVLEQTRMVTSLRKGRYRRYFENGAILTTTKDIVAILRNPVTAGVVDTIKRAPGATQKELAAATNMTPQALHWHLARLVEGGVVRKEREGRVVRHFSS